MLVTNVGGLTEIVPDQKCGYVVKLDVSGISEKILDYFVNDREKEFTENVIVEKKKYEWKTFIGVLIGLFEKTGVIVGRR